MRKLVVLCLALFVSPLFAQSSADLTNCISLPKGQRICGTQDGKGFVVDGSLVVENGRVYAAEGASLGGLNYFGGDETDGGMVIGRGGVVVRGNLAVMPNGALLPLIPQYADNGYVWYYSEKDATASDRFSTMEKPTVRVEIDSRFAGLYANLDPATRGGYQVYLTSSELGKGVEVVEQSPDHFVVRSLTNEDCSFSYAIRAFAIGHRKPRFLSIGPNTSAETPEENEEMIRIIPGRKE